MKFKRKYILYIALLAIAISCKKPYTPPQITAPSSYLVVEGTINSGSDTTFINLSRTRNLGDSVNVSGERGATVIVEGDGTSYNLPELRNGVYAHQGLNLDVTKKYHLRIKTADGQEYLSDDVEVKSAPPIDDVGYEIKDKGLQINVSTHDPANKTLYYRWEYVETWRFHTRYRSDFVVAPARDTVILRTAENQIYYCFNTVASSTISIASSTKLSQDVISKAPLTLIAPESDKISMRYSILVKQYALTKEAYEFWENLKKNTETLGSIFDALPSEISGNIHNIKNPSEPVIGYISAGAVQSKRVFIDKSQLPDTWKTAYPESCRQDTTLYVGDHGFNEVRDYILLGTAIPTASITDPRGFTIIGFYRTDPICADCTLRGRVQQPAFWK
ncbi:DUF4249 domain-containing protein [Inquilinus sp. KBS0705]|nr:DUF4249 domain-containing protein [Inquilinus sp. KBS0705]